MEIRRNSQAWDNLLSLRFIVPKLINSVGMKYYDNVYVVGNFFYFVYFKFLCIQAHWLYVFSLTCEFMAKLIHKIYYISAQGTSVVSHQFIRNIVPSSYKLFLIIQHHSTCYCKCILMHLLEMYSIHKYLNRSRRLT